MEGFYAASKMKLKKAENLTIYGVAQCLETLTPDACRGCINSAYESIKACLSATDGRLIDAGCFMRFSNAPFFNDSQITDLKPFIRTYLLPIYIYISFLFSISLISCFNLITEDSSKDKAAIGGVAGGAGLAIIIVAVSLWFIFSRKLKIATRGDRFNLILIHGS